MVAPSAGTSFICSSTTRTLPAARGGALAGQPQGALLGGRPALGSGTWIVKGP